MSTDATSMTPRSNTAIKVNWVGIGLFLVLTFGLSWAAFIGLRALGWPLVVYAAVGMFGPALAALLIRLIRREGFADAGLRLVGRGQRGGWRMYLAAYVVPPLVIAAGIGLVLLIGYQHWALSENIKQLQQVIVATLHKSGQELPTGMTPEQLTQISLMGQIVAAFTYALIINSVFTFGEEFGWRGYLLPRLAPLGGVTAAIVTGVIWGLWHAPLIIMNGYNYPGHPWLGVAMMAVFCASFGVVQAWLRFRSGSIWPAVLAHAAFNAQAGFGALLLARGDSLLSAPIGLIGLVPLIVLATVLVTTRQLKPDMPESSS